MTEETITLVDEQGNEHEFDLLEMVEVDGCQYAVLLPTESPEKGAVLLRLEKDEKGADVLVHVEDDEEFEKVKTALQALEE